MGQSPKTFAVIYFFGDERGEKKMKTDNPSNQAQSVSKQPFHFDFSRKLGWPASSRKQAPPGTSSFKHSVDTEVEQEIFCRGMELRAASRITGHPQLRQHCSAVHFYFEDGCLIVAGSVPSFYLKQLIQETIRNLEGIDRVDNRLLVQLD
jgi:hypothetical protein